MLELNLVPHTLSFRRPAATSRGLLHERRIWFVVARDSHRPDVTGWGECGPIPGLSPDDRPDFAHAIQRMVDEINASSITLRAAHHRAALQVVAGLMAEFAPNLANLPSFAFGLETALLDLLHGGRRRLWETPFARGEIGLDTHGLIWMDTPENILHQIDVKVAAGHRAIKLKVGSLPFDQECELLTEVRRRFAPGQMELRLDANGAFSPDEALDRLNRLAHFEIAFIEQPIPPGHASQMALLCRRSPIPICLDEELIGLGVHERRDLLATIRPQHIILKPALLGGFGACRVWSDACDEAGCQWWVNSLLESNMGLNAICQWCAAVGGGRVHGLGTGQLFANNIVSPLRYVMAQIQHDPVAGWTLPPVEWAQPQI